ncbi:MBOAT family O-acyltransferase [Ureibacillus endophyticus]|uniref:MBOAT family protein n=1 Tax=Ureibacillus endophyticus TaxID=1978490 RepID=A0A494Z1X7_9BACL|nr:MBOAT family O-acyltransferase [Lysinibacillus endophyticus]RKQ16438.1 hypothetical protein D8M03_10105 [Lysinibacillus endophyticus]
MLFTSFEFIFLFLPVVFIGYFILTKVNFSLAKLFLVLSSFFFYSWWNIAYLPLLLGSIVFNYFYGKLLSFKQSKFLLTLGIIVNVLVLGYFKYMDFFISNVNFLFSTNYGLLYLLLPLGISFFTFQQIAYLVDSHRKESKDYSILDYSLFISFFPQLIAGPIVYHKEMLPQFVNNENQRINIQNIATGIFIFILGLFKKVGIADTFAKWANLGFDNSADLAFLEGWITSLSYTMYKC